MHEPQNLKEGLAYWWYDIKRFAQTELGWVSRWWRFASIVIVLFSFVMTVWYALEHSPSFLLALRFFVGSIVFPVVGFAGVIATAGAGALVMCCYKGIYNGARTTWIDKESARKPGQDFYVPHWRFAIMSGIAVAPMALSLLLLITAIFSLTKHIHPFLWYAWFGGE